MTNPTDDDLDLVDRLRTVADALPSADEVRRRAVETGMALGLPRAWLEALPEVGLLPGAAYRGGSDDEQYGADASLKWASLEHLVRTGRVAELSADDLDLVAAALELAGSRDGRNWLRNAVQDMMFCIICPRRTYSLHVDLQMAAERILDCLTDSPSSLLFAAPADIERAWQHTVRRVYMLDPEVVLPETSPWPNLADALRAAADRIAESREAERTRVQGEDGQRMLKSQVDHAMDWRNTHYGDDGHPSDEFSALDDAMSRLSETTRALAIQVERHADRMDADLTDALREVQAALARMEQSDRRSHGGDDGKKR